MSIDNCTWVPAGARHTYKDDHGSTWTTYKSHGQMPNNQKTPHQVFLAHVDRDEQYFFQDADDARWFWLEGYMGSLFLDQDDPTLMSYDHMALWIDGKEIDQRGYVEHITAPESVTSEIGGTSEEAAAVPTLDDIEDLS